MRFMMLMIPKGYETAEPGTMPDAKAVEAMMKYNEDLQKAGVLLALDGLHPPSMGARVSFKGGKPTVTDGPFTEAKEVLGGYWMIRVKSKEEAIEWAKRCPASEQRSDRDPAGAGVRGLPRRRAEGRGRVPGDAGAVGTALNTVAVRNESGANDVHQDLRQSAGNGSEEVHGASSTSSASRSTRSSRMRPRPAWSSATTSTRCC